MKCSDCVKIVLPGDDSKTDAVSPDYTKQLQETYEMAVMMFDLKDKKVIVDGPFGR